MAMAYSYGFLGIGGSAAARAGIFASCFIVIAFIQLTISAAYVFQAYTYFRPLQLHLQHPGSNPPREHVEAIQRVIFYVRLSIFSMVVNFACFASFILNLYYMNHAAYICIMCCFAWSRITTSFSQMRAISPKAASSCSIHVWDCSSKKLRIAASPAPRMMNTISSLTGEVVNQSEDLARLAMTINGSGSGTHSPSENRRAHREQEQGLMQLPARTQTRHLDDSAHGSHPRRSWLLRSSRSTLPLPSIEEEEESEEFGAAAPSPPPPCSSHSRSGEAAESGPKGEVTCCR